MRLIVFFIYVPLVYSELHTFITTYTGIRGQKFAGIPKFSAVTTLDGHQIDYYDSDIQKLIPKQDWMKEFESEVQWKEDTEIRKHVLLVYKNNIPVLMERFSQSHGVHTFQRMYGCVWDDETGVSQGFDQYGYDGEDFISLDLKKLRYTAHEPQASLTVDKWNKDRIQLEIQKRYFEHDCVYWLKKFLHLSKATFEKADPPQVSLLQENPESNVKCHVTGFLFRNTIISWRKNGQALSDSNELETGDTLPNEDGTFQRTVTLYVHPDKWKKSQYVCEVEHKSLTETIQKILTEDEIKSNSKMRPEPGLYASYIKWVPVIIPVIISVIVLSGLIVLYVCCKCQKKIKDAWKKIINCKNKLSPSEQKKAVVPTPSEEHTPLQESGTSEGADRHRITFQNLHLHSSSPVERSSQPCATTESFNKDQETSKDI